MCNVPAVYADFDDSESAGLDVAILLTHLPIPGISF